MRPQKLSKKLNPLGEIMNLPEAFNQLKNKKHDSSFENLGEWVNQNTSKPKKMKTFYKIAASFVLTAFVLIACSIPVQHEEEIGFMIKGISSNPESELIENMKKAKESFGNQVGMSFSVIHIDGESSKSSGEIILLLPHADENEARTKMQKLDALFGFETIDLHPIEENVEEPLYKAALSKINIKFGDSLSDEVIVEQFNKALHENTSLSGNAEFKKDKNGNKVFELVITEESLKESGNLLNGIDPNSIKSIKITKDAEGKKIIEMDVDEVIEN